MSTNKTETKPCHKCGSTKERWERVFSSQDHNDPDCFFVDTLYCCDCGEVKDFKN